MKVCPTCRRTYDDTLTYCLSDGSLLSDGYDPQATLQYPEPRKTEPPPTEILPADTDKKTIESSSASSQTKDETIPASTSSPFVSSAKPIPLLENRQSIKPVKVVTRIVFAFVVIILVIVTVISLSWGIYNSFELSRERSSRLRAEQEARENKTALTKAELRAKDAEETLEALEAIRLGKEVWRIVRIENRTKGPIPYQIVRDGTTTNYSVEAGKSLTHSSDADIILVFDNSYDDGIQEKRYRVTPKYVIGHKPTSAEEQQAKVNYFELNKSGIIELYLEK